MRKQRKEKLLRRWLACLLALAMILTGVNWVPIKAEAVSAFYWPVPSTKTWTTYTGHKGIDITCANGTKVYAAKDGTIVKVWNSCNHHSTYNTKTGTYCGCNNGFGNGIVIRHNDGTWTEYAHMTLNSFPSSIRENAKVSKGDYLGKSGDTGKATGPHLHFGIRQGSGSTYSNFWNCKVLNAARTNGDVVYEDSVDSASDPEILDYEVSVDSAGYTLTCWVNDSVNDVEFLTWSDANGTDDRIGDDMEQKGKKWSARINIADHNGETGAYTTRIYANESKKSYDRIDVNVKVPTYKSAFPLQNNGIYKLTNALCKKSPAVSSASKANSAQIVLSPFESWMTWKAVKHADGYSFISTATGKALTVENSSTKEGAKIVQYDYTGSTAQRFKVVQKDKTTDQYALIVICSNMCIDVNTNNTQDGAPVTHYPYEKADEQHWIFEAVASESESPEPAEKTCTVIFKDDEDNVIETQEVAYGKPATAPAAPVKTGYTFDRWDTDFSAVTEDLTVTAIYTRINGEDAAYTITYILNGGTNHPSNPSSYAKSESVTLQDPSLAGKYFGGWFDDNGKQVTIISGKNISVSAKWLDVVDPWRKDGELWIDDIPEQYYTGKAIKPQVNVYNGQELLQEKKDYTVTYKNNINANDASNQSTAPTVIITGIGNYSGRETAVFSILPKDITDWDVDAADLFLPASGTVQKPVPVIKWNSVTLKNNTDFKLDYPDNAAGAYQDVGNYNIRITGSGNYTGEKTVNLQLTASSLMSKATVTAIPNQTYTGQEIEPALTAKYGTTLLQEGTDYTITYRDNITPGTATAILTGMGAYVGEKRVTFKITSIPMSKVTVRGIPKSVVYSSLAEYALPYELEATLNGSNTPLLEDWDFSVTYKNNTKAGTATIIFTGLSGFNGTIRKTFKITPYNIATDSEHLMDISDDLTVPYAKNGAKIDPLVTCNGVVLVKGKDYTLSYQNNKNVSDSGASQKQPTAVITGIGNYKGKITRNFTITEQDIRFLSMTASDKVYKNKAGNFISVPVIKDSNGATLQAGKDYSKIRYTYTNGTEISAREILPVGTQIIAIAEGKGNYTGEIRCAYRITAANISTVKFKVTDQTYTGRAITPGKDAITLKLGSTTLQDSDYEIIGYSNNIKKGTATITIRGTGDYGGTKKITFKIKSRNFLWWWR